LDYSNGPVQLFGGRHFEFRVFGDTVIGPVRHFGEARILGSGTARARVRVVPKERTLSVTELDALCTAFLKLPTMNESSSRDLYINTLNGQLANALSVPRYLDPRHDVWSILRACQDHANGIRTLADVVRYFHRDSRPMMELDALIECLFPDELLDPVEREQLVSLLVDVEPKQLQLACRYAGPPSWLTAAPDWSDPATLARRLESCVGRAGVPPPLLVFVDFVAHQLDAVRSAEQHRWIDKVGARTNLSVTALRGLCVSAVARLDEAQRFYFIVQLQPDGAEPNSYLMSVWLQQHLSVEEPLYRDDTPITLPEVAERLQELLTQAHAALGVSAGELVLEFILPRSLIGQPIDQWEIDPVFPHRLGTSYPVIVRSLDRLRNLEIHGPWRQKWRWLADNGHREEPAAIYWLLEPNTRTPNSLRATLLSEPSVVVLAMAFPPEESLDLVFDELSAALYGGMPAVLWCRDDKLRPRFEHEVRELLNGHGLVELPTRVLQLRQRADETDNPATLGRHLTLLWDDAERMPQSFTRSPRLRAPQ
jgi:hypothetical protein